MRAIAADTVGLGLASASLREVDDASAGPGQVLVRVHAVSINSADLKVLSWNDGASFIHAKARPHVVGYDLSGVVEAGSGAGLQPGDAVFGFLPYSSKTRTGSLAELVACDVGWLAKKPEAVSHAQAATLGTAGVTALQGWRDKLGLQAGQRVLVHGGSGGVGSFAIQVAKLLGAGEVVATSSAAKAEIVESLGADVVVDYRATPIEAIEGPFDALFDAAVKTSYRACKHMLAPAGGYLTLLPTPSFMLDKIASLFSKRHVEFLAVSAVREDLEQLATWCAEGVLRPHVGASFSLSRGAEALAAFDSGKHAGKIVVEVEGS